MFNHKRWVLDLLKTTWCLHLCFYSLQRRNWALLPALLIIVQLVLIIWCRIAWLLTALGRFNTRRVFTNWAYVALIVVAFDYSICFPIDWKLAKFLIIRNNKLGLDMICVDILVSLILGVLNKRFRVTCLPNSMWFDQFLFIFVKKRWVLLLLLMIVIRKLSWFHYQISFDDLLVASLIKNIIIN